MQRERKLYLSICDYNKNAVCDIYDNQSDISGQACNVFIDTERNGWKQLSFDIPSTCMSEEGLVPNYRLNCLIAEYKIKAVTDEGTDWFIISEPKITRNNFSKNVSVIAGHVSQLLKNKSLDLEFSDEEGNNVGTAAELLATILEGSGWTPGEVADFKENDGMIKKRSMSAQAGTGALNLIEELCDLFEAKPVYDGDLQTVSLYEMNPFAKVNPEEIPQKLKDGRSVIELSYSRNVHDLHKTTNTENMATRLYAYGSSGDLNGACTLQTAEHSEYIFTVSETGAEYCFEDLDENRYFFKGDVSVNDRLIWSDMDITSKMYIWNDTKREAYKVYFKPTDSYKTLSDVEYEVKENKFPYITSFKYYSDVGLLTDEQFQEIAAFQRDMPQLYDDVYNASVTMNEDQQNLSTIVSESNGFLKLNVLGDFSPDLDDPQRGLKIPIATEPIYRTDYMEAERRYFQWHVAKQIKPNGDPVYSPSSYILIVHNTDPATYDKVFLKRIYDQNNRLIVDSKGEPGDFSYDTDNRPAYITVWSNSIRYNANDKYYLFCTNGTSGTLGSKISSVNETIETLNNVTKEGSEEHPVYFIESTESLPSDKPTTYGWCYKIYRDWVTDGDLYFCWGKKGDTTWYRAYVQDTVPSSAANGTYFYNLRDKKLYKRTGGTWEAYTTEEGKRVANKFNNVYSYCKQVDMLYRGLYEYYTYEASNLPIANYAFASPYGFFWTFTTDRRVSGTLKLDLLKGYVWQDNTTDHIVTFSTTPYETVFFPVANEFESVRFVQGNISAETGVEIPSDSLVRSGTIKVYENTRYDYDLPANSKVCYYNSNLSFIGAVALTGAGGGSTGNFTTPASTKYIRIVSSQIPSSYLHVHDYDKKFYINNKEYNILSPIGHSGELNGIYSLLVRFTTLSDKAYKTDLDAFNAIQEDIKERENSLTISLGDMLKDGRWQDSNYIKGDEKRLYDEAYDMLRQISMPEITYDFTYLDMYGVHNEHYYEEHPSQWPDISILDTAHLIDTEINTNCWAYIDKIHKCYDQEWKTTIEVDTKLTLAARHSFTDIIARIAEVAKQLKSKQPLYDRAALGNVAASRLEGAISLYNTILKGGVSNWYTDDKGNIILDAVDGLSSMMLSGRGLGVSVERDEYGDWKYRTAITGYGITADEIYTGYLSADRIEAGSITTSKISSDFGQELNISSNEALKLFATEDGTRPAGSLKTTDALIEIIAGHGTTPAQINVLSGGELNMQGGDVNIHSSGSLNVSSDGEFTLKSKGANSLDSTADGIYMGSDGINFGGGKFKVSFNGNTSTVTMNAALINIGNNQTLDDKFTEIEQDISDMGQEIETKSIVETVRVYKTGTSSTTPPALTRTGYENDPTWQESVLTVDSTNKYLWSRNRYKTKEGKYTFGTPVYETELSSKISKTHTEYMRTNSDVAPSATASGWQMYVPAPSKNSSGIELNPYVWACTYILYTNGESTRIDIHRETGLESMSGAAITATNIAAGITAVPKVSSTGILIDGNYLKVQSTGEVQILGNGSVYVGSSSSNSAVVINKDGIAIGSAGSIAIVSGEGVTGATVVIGNAGKAFTIGSDGTNAYIYNGRTSIDATGTNGIYIGTDGINVGKADGSYVKATADGTVDISGKISAKDGEIGGWLIKDGYLYGNLTGMAKTTNGTDIAFWAGASYANRASAPFRVTQDGALTTTSGTIAGWTITPTSITGNKTGIGKTTDDADIAFWAGNTTAGSAPFRVTQGGALYATNADIKGTVKATSLYIGATSTSNGTLLKADSSGFVVSNSTSNVGTAIKTTAGIEVDSSGVVIEAGKTAGAAVLAAASIKVDSSGVVIGASSTASTAVKSAAGIKVDSSGVVISSSTSDTGAAVKSAAGIQVDATTGIAISASGTAGSTSASKVAAITLKNGKIQLSATEFDSLGSKTSGIYISPSEINISTAGAFVVSAGNFQVDSDGNVTLSSVNVPTETGGTTTVNLSDPASSYPLWKLYYANIKSVEVKDGYCTKMIFTSKVGGASSVNFKHATAVEGSWSGNIYTASDGLTEDKVEIYARCTGANVSNFSAQACSSGSGGLTSRNSIRCDLSVVNGTASNASVKVTAQNPGGDVDVASISVSGVFEAGGDAAGLEMDTENHQVKRKTNSIVKAYTITVSGGSWSKGAITASAKILNTEIASTSISLPSVTSTAWTNTTGNTWRADITLGGAVRNSGTKDFTFLHTNGLPKTSVTHILKGSRSGNNFNCLITSNDGTKTTVTVDCSLAISAGSSDGYSSAKVSKSWSGAVCTFSKSTSGANSYSITADARVGLTYSSSTHKYTASAQAVCDGADRGTAVTKTSGTEAYEAGTTTGYNNAKIAKSWSGSKVTLSKSKSGSDSVSLTVGASAGINYNSSAHTYTASAQASCDGANRASDSSTSGTEAYEAGASSVTVSDVSLWEGDAKLSGEYTLNPGSSKSIKAWCKRNDTWVGGDTITISAAGMGSANWNYYYEPGTNHIQVACTISGSTFYCPRMFTGFA